MSVLLVAPFSLTWGSVVHTEVNAGNLIGENTNPLTCPGPVLMSNPDAPLSFAETVNLKTATSISFSWVEGLSNKGAVVQDYTLSYTTGTVYSVFASGIVPKYYTATGLTTGTTYKFVV